VQPSPTKKESRSRRCSSLNTEKGDLPIIKCTGSPPCEKANLQELLQEEENEHDDRDISEVAAELNKMTSNIEQKLKLNKRQQIINTVIPLKVKEAGEQNFERRISISARKDNRPLSAKSNEPKLPNSSRTPEELEAKLLKITPVVIDSLYEQRLRRVLWGCSITGVKPEKKKWRCQDSCLLDPDFDNPNGSGSTSSLRRGNSGASLNSSRAGSIHADHQPVTPAYAKDRQVLLAVFDGHGNHGREISSQCASELPALLRGHHYRRDPANALKKAFVKLHRALFADADLDAEYSGTTATCCLLRGSQLHVAHVGDSRAALIRRREVDASTRYSRRRKNPPPYQLVELTVDHKVNDPQERRRILREGGIALPNPLETKRPAMDEVPYRVWKSEDMLGGPGLAMSRSLGDNVAHTLGVSAEPDISMHDLDPAQDVLLMVGSDGIWDVLEEKEIIQAVAKNFKDKKGSIRNLAHEICQLAYRKWISSVMRSDDITIAILNISDVIPSKTSDDGTPTLEKKWNTNSRVPKHQTKLKAGT